MPPNSIKFDTLNERTRGQLRRQLQYRRDRLDSYDDIAFFIRTRYGITVSSETVRQWCLRYLSDSKTG